MQYKNKRLIRSGLMVFAFSLLSFNFVFADPASSNYSVAESWFPSGGGSAQSTNYKAEETTIDAFDTPILSSSNFGLEGKIGIKGTEKIPYITAVSPGNFSKHYPDETASFTVTATTPDGDTLQYSGRQNATLKDGPQSSNQLDWALTGSGIGRHVMSLEAIDPDGTVSKQQPAYIYRRPVK